MYLNILKKGIERYELIAKSVLYSFLHNSIVQL